MATNPPDGPGRAWLGQHLRTALTYLYDPTVLRSSPLVALLGLEGQRDRAGALRLALLDAIESLKPNQSTPKGSKVWRVYQVLRRRYTEQVSQREVAADLGLSIRQLQREEHDARAELADHLWAAYDLAERDLAGLAPDGPDEGGADDEGEDSARAQELEWLQSSVPRAITDLGELVVQVLETARPLLAAAAVTAEYTAPAALSPVLIRAPLLRQALLDLVSALAACVPGGRLALMAAPAREGIGLRIEALPGAAPSACPDGLSDLEMARLLIERCDGTLTSEMAAGRLAARITIPVTEQVTVLVIDDNADALQLIERYLSGTRYQFVGAQAAEQGMRLAQELAPPLILLDVMLPGRDGWTVLGQLRAHPRTHDAAVIVCTILSQESLALALGAAAFIRKPVRRQPLLAVLDQQLALLRPGHSPTS